MTFTTPVQLPTSDLKIAHESRIILAGSCFAENIGERLCKRKFNILGNPFGILYNPLSIATMLERVVSGEPFTASSSEIFEHNELWHSLLHHSCFSQKSKEELIDTLNESLAEAHRLASGCDILILTFGTAYIYTRNSDNLIAGNCHKLPGNIFTRRLATIEEITENFIAVIEKLRNMNPDIKFIFTVSPIRHLRDGAHDNQKSKATLLLAIDRIQSMFSDCVHYFPAYEIVLDELRDYRFFAEDMTHPSNIAIEYIWECFSRTYFGEATNKLNREIEEVTKALDHRPFNPDSAAHKRFIKNVLDKIEAIQDKHPYLNFENETAQCNTLLNR